MEALPLKSESRRFSFYSTFLCRSFFCPRPGCSWAWLIGDLISKGRGVRQRNLEMSDLRSMVTFFRRRRAEASPYQIRNVSVVKSFDIFETLVTRPFAPPHKLFPLVATIAKRIHNLSIDPCAFEGGRVLAEKRTRKRADRTEVTIEDIYRECRSILRLSKEDVQVLISCEIKLEIELCRPIRTGLALLENARHEGSRVVFISDTYLPGSALRAILVRNGCWKEGDRLYV